MRLRWFGVVGASVPALALAQTGSGPYARIAVLRPHDGHTVDFEAGYIRHLAWHQQAGDPWTWYGWSVWAGDRQRWFVYATFGHSAASFDSAVAPAEDERDNVLNVVPHAEFAGNALFEFLPALSRGSGNPQPTPRLELMTVELRVGEDSAFEAALRARHPALREETLWYRMVVGGPSPRYVRLRPRANLTVALTRSGDDPLPESAHPLIVKTTVEMLTLRPTMSLGVRPQAPK
jgi:hypothetical protein